MLHTFRTSLPLCSTYPDICIIESYSENFVNYTFLQKTVNLDFT